jgi:NAD binding domain of 6-phosphogluconate dehydrogenase
MQFHKVLVIGLGQLGLPVAKYVMERGFDTYGYDISIKAMEHAKKRIGIKILAPLFCCRTYPYFVVVRSSSFTSFIKYTH